jgi:serine/threonine-protein kinase
VQWLSDESIGRLRQAMEMPDFAGTRYSLLEPLGSGGMGTVYLATDRELDRNVAVKVLHVEDLSTDVSDRLLREARILAQLEHPGIVPVHDAGRLADGRLFYVMKRVDGKRLDQFREARPSRAETLGLFLKICDAVAFAHSRGVVHRDLKPENIMVGPFGEVLVLDWGIAKWIRAPEPARFAAASGTRHGDVLGTPEYMPPEQSEGRASDVDERSDVYALGAILRYLLANDQEMPARLRAIWRKAMSEHKPDRYTSVSELAADISRFLDQQPVTAYRENVLERATRLAYRYRTAILLIAAYLLMRILLIVFRQG